ncbi:MAG: hypothetical protein IPJ65_07605 [Archangiaceae bacterium]|nr:hypothetical protein [Archangiaceae bacterium]
MVRALAAAVSLFAAADSKGDAEKKVDAAMQKSCESAKKNAAAHSDACADAVAAFEKLDCADQASRQSVDFLKLNAECAKKAKAEKK